MRSIFKLLAANLRYKKGAFVGIVVLMTIVTLSYAITVSNNRNLERTVDSSFAEQEIGDLVFMLQESPASETLQFLRAQPEITAVHETPYLNTDAPVQIGGKEYDDIESLRCETEYDRRVDPEKKKVGEHVPLKKGEICLAYRLSREREIEVGTQIRIRTRNGFDESFTVCGFYQEITNNTVKCGLLCKEDFDRLYGEKQDALTNPHRVLFGMTELHVSVQNGTDMYALKQTLRNGCSLFDDALNVLTKEELRNVILLMTATGSRILAVYIVLLVAIVLIVIGNSISTSVETEYVNLGVLKANGFDKGQLRAVWVLQYALAVLIGSVCGVLLSVPATVFFGSLFSRLSNIITDNSTAFGRCILVALVILAVCVIYVFLATAKVGRISPVRAISEGRSEIYFESRLQVRIRKKGLRFFIALRQLTSGFTGYLGSMIIVALLVFFLCTVMIYAGQINPDLFMMPTGDVEIQMYNAKTHPAQEIREICRRYDPDAEIQLWTGRYLFADDEKILLNAYNSDALFTKPLEGRLPEYDNEVLVTELFAKKVQKQIGDTVTVRNGKIEADFVITGLIQSVKNPAGVLEITEAGGRRIGFSVPDMGYVVLSDLSQRAALTDALNAEMSDVLSAKEFEQGSYMQDIIHTVNLIVNAVLCAVYGVSLVFAAVVVVMICRRTFIKEQTDLGIYRALGFSVPLLRQQFAVRFLLVAVCGSAAGCLCAVFGSGKLLSLMMRMIGLSRFDTADTWTAFLLPAAAVSAACFIVGYLASRRIRTVSVRTLITE